ncbi:hypothetical protein [Streptomyces sp. NBC_01361]|uniref:hypothetical protein n=1 Tax=Streptomyces sp. NBC_01361 TaxID=2903838 RepID=UPI002E322A27|nr:hypothetical protein [Streptomyces sp. NBC_01361]
MRMSVQPGVVNLSEAEQLQAHHTGLLGKPASDSATRRTLAALDERTLKRIAKAWARARRHVWQLLRLRPGGSPG